MDSPSLTARIIKKSSRYFGRIRTDRFPKVICDINTLGWHDLDYDKYCKELFKKRLGCILVEKLKEAEDCDLSDDQRDLKKATYNGINLYKSTIYSICVDLRIYPNELSLDNELHAACIGKWYGRCKIIIDRVQECFKKNTIKKAIISQGYTLNSAVIGALAKQNNLEVFSIENTFHKDKLMWDNINGTTLNSRIPQKFFNQFRNTLPQSSAKDYVKAFNRSIKNLKLGEHTSPHCPPPSFDGKLILFLGQVYTDSSILFGIRHFPTPLEIVYELANYCAVRRTDCYLFVKLHPKEATGGDTLYRDHNYLTFRKLDESRRLKPLINANEKIMIDRFNTYDTYALIERADVCVTVNSQSGLEAAVRGKPVVLCGQSYYSNLGFTWDIQRRKDLTSYLDLVLENTSASTRVEEACKFFYIFLEKYCIPKDEKSLINRCCRDN